MITRLLVLMGLLVVAFLVVTVLERVRFRRSSPLPSGVTLVTGPNCSLCDAANRALRAAGLQPATVPVASVPGLGVRSVPTALVVGTGGELVLRRAGRAILTGIPAIVAAARSAGVGS